ncbi:hypothetical protein H0B56_16820 [Haloechinothrix sp. YIM 98757]|uniref:Cobalamin-independent methionine synthase MetE C-terminal/archaeal domain-containing protein n=1 Tax=Haloechinothrix aidingensis TaxID=2752311 RepID=A0A838AD50_9PSEU|nr:hypothetical protein [Haloechinothrix aidingensis]
MAEENDSTELPLLPTTVVGSYSVPEWLESVKTDFYQRKISRQYLDDIHDVATKAALKDQERTGIDVVSGGELRRDNDVDYLLSRIPGIDIPDVAKSDSYNYFDAVVSRPLPDNAMLPLGLVDDLSFTSANTDRPVKFSFTGPLSLSRRIRNHAYSDSSELVRALARLLNMEAKRLAQAGATWLQIDEPFLCGYRDQVDVAVEGVNIITSDVDVYWSLHVCYGNRYARPIWEGHYDFLFPGVLDANVDQLVFEFARRGYGDLGLFERFGWDRSVGLGVIDVKTEEVETAGTVAGRIRTALRTIPAERLVINPDCGLRHLPAHIARAKLLAMVDGAAMVRSELRDTRDRGACHADSAREGPG